MPVLGKVLIYSSYKSTTEIRTFKTNPKPIKKLEFAPHINGMSTRQNANSVFLVQKYRSLLFRGVLFCNALASYKLDAHQILMHEAFFI